jgi:small subunit ribosomal protein S1
MVNIPTNSEKEQTLRKPTATGAAEGRDPALDSAESGEPSMNMYEDSFGQFKEGEVVTGVITAVDKDLVLVDIGYKSEGQIRINEFRAEDGTITAKVGDRVEVMVEWWDDEDERVILSKEKAANIKVWDNIKKCHDEDGTIRGVITSRVKGGFSVDIGVPAFLPGSQADLRPIRNLDDMVGKTYDFKILKYNRKRSNIVLSRRVLLEKERESKRAATLSSIHEGKVLSGIVKNITEYGVFVDLGGVDGLLHITDISWGRVSHPSELVQIGDRVKVKVLSFDPEKERISLGMKQLTPYPWEDVDKRYGVQQRVKGKVVSITDYGAFVELEKGIEGLIHISEMSWTRHVRHPSKVVAIGDQIEAMILKIDKENEKISLGLKQIEPDPWLTLDQRFPLGTRLTGKVRNLTNFGAFVEIEEGIDGLVHISDMSWTRRVAHPSEVLKKGDRVDVVVLSIDKDARRISLGLKQTGEDPWPSIAERFIPDVLVKGKVVRLLDRGVIVDMDEGLEGFIPLSQLGIEGLRKPSDSFKPGDEMDLKVTRVDSQAHRIILSARAWLADQNREMQEAFQVRFKPNPSAEGAEPAAEPGPEAAEGDVTA